eukprot:scaffold147485_cov23-Cyclotella_meneghiniana.AAC.1
MPKTKPTYNGSSSGDDGSNYSDTARDDSSDDEEFSANHHHCVYDDVNELKVVVEWRPGRGQLLGGI